MDKDSVILKYMQQEVEYTSNDLRNLQQENDRQIKQLDVLQDKINAIYKKLGKEPPVGKDMTQFTTTPESKCELHSPDGVSYDTLFNKASTSLRNRGLDVDNLDYHSLISPAELEEIISDLNKPLSKREHWIKPDFMAVFIAAGLGSLADIILSNRNNSITGKDSSFSNWLDQFHNHQGGAPIDYQGKGFGGGFHRELSKGHDILRFIESIMMFKNGEFVGVRYVNGQAIKIISNVNQYGTPYSQLTTLEAILRYIKHMVADLLSTVSLPFPGSSYLAESSNRELRKLAATMYQNGFNCKNIIIQSLSTIIIEIIIRVYFSIQSVQSSNQNFDIDEEYSNYDSVNHFIPSQNKEKMYEMLLVAHAIVMAINVGKVVIKKAPWELNITEIVAVIRYGIRAVKKVMQSNSEYGKLIRNANTVHDTWQQLDREITLNDLKSTISSAEILVI